MRCSGITGIGMRVFVTCPAIGVLTDIASSHLHIQMMLQGNKQHACQSPMPNEILVLCYALGRYLFWQIRELDLAPIAQRKAQLKDVDHLSDVAGPGIIGQRLFRVT